MLPTWHITSCLYRWKSTHLIQLMQEQCVQLSLMISDFKCSLFYVCGRFACCGYFFWALGKKRELHFLLEQPEGTDACLFSSFPSGQLSHDRFDRHCPGVTYYCLGLSIKKTYHKLPPFLIETACDKNDVLQTSKRNNWDWSPESTPTEGEHQLLNCPLTSPRTLLCQRHKMSKWI